MTPEDMAATYACAFPVYARAWRADEFATLLQDRTVFTTGDVRAFAVTRVIADEAELLTLACAPEFRRQGLASACLGALVQEARARGARRLFLEVAADNHAALALYDRAAFNHVGRRARYYARPGAQSEDALILEKSFGSDSRGALTGT